MLSRKGKWDMSIAPEDARHLTLSTIDILWANGVPIELPIAGDPVCHLRLDPKNRKISLVTAYQIPEPDVTKFKNVSYNAAVESELDVAELTVRVDDNAHGAYGLLATLADQIQVERLPLAAAVAVAVTRHRDVFAARGTLSTEREVGLFGEMLFLEYLIRAIGPNAAIATWQGPLAEEHDFTFEALHIEVKTTSSERRKHVVHGLNQLVPVGDVPLALLSIQLTRSAPEGGQTLTGLISEVRKIAGGYVVAIDKMLDTFGWHPDGADLYSTFWALRSLPRAYLVGGDFPAMTPDLVAPVVPNFQLLSDVQYRVDLTNLNHYSLPDPISGFAEIQES
jgi:hypothetical protein